MLDESALPIINKGHPIFIANWLIKLDLVADDPPAIQTSL